jgi:predicted peroxiredoxin
MFEDMIMQLDEMGVAYSEDYDTGSLTIDVGALDKITLISVIQMANDSGLDFTVDETSLVIMAGAPVEAMPEEDEALDLATMQDEAMNELF